MKSKILPLLALSAVLVLSGCGGGKDKKSSIDSSIDNPSTSVADSSQGGNSSVDPGTSNIPDDEEYAISVNAATGVKATLSKTKAKAGETVTLALVVDSGFTVKSVEATNTTMNKVTDTSYNFVMPNRSVRITINVDIEGDYVLTGEIAAVLNKVEGKNLYCAKGVKVAGTKARLNFSYAIRTSGGAQVVPAINFDEARSFADCESASSSSGYQLSIATGSTYDFYYDPASEFPCYIIRTSVDVMPKNSDQIQSLFEGRMRSEPACHPTDLVGIDYTFKSPTLSYTYNYKKYVDNTSFATVLDTTDPDNPENYYVYKHADFVNNIYTVVNTWTKDLGNNENEYYLWKLDPYNDGDRKYHQPFSAQVDIVENDTDNRYQTSVRDANRDIAAGAHYGHELEYEIYDTYRSVYSGNVVINAPSWTKLDIKPTENTTTGGFDIAIESATEYNHDGSTNTADATLHEGHVNSVKMSFLKNGALKTLEATMIDYEQKEWDFTNHKPLKATGGTKKVITCNNTFGDDFTGKPNFDITPYFISKINSASWFNPLTEQTASKTESHVNYNDVLELIPYGNANHKADNVNSFEFEPATALDAWQYGISSWADDKIVGLNPQNRVWTVGTGSSEVTITNRTSNSAKVQFKTKVSSYAKGTVHGFFINCTKPGYDSFGCDNSTILEGRAGKTLSYYVDTSYNTGAPTLYELYFRTKNKFGDYEYSQTSEYVNIVQTGTVLILDFNTDASNALKEDITLTVKVMSDFYAKNWGPSEWQIHISPNDNIEKIIGSEWIYNGYVDVNKNPIKDYSTINLSNEKSEKYTDYYKGIIKDFNYEGDTLLYTNTWSFVYKITNIGAVDIIMTSMDVQNPDFKGTDLTNYILTIDGMSNGLLKVCFSYWEVSMMGVSDVVDIFGNADYTEDDGNYYYYVENYQGFTRTK